MLIPKQNDNWKFLSLLLLIFLLLATKASGVSNVRLNNEKMLTLTVLDSFYFSFDYGTGDSCADVEVWIDLDEDLIIDPAVDWPLFISKDEGEFFCDGDMEDLSPPKDGTYKLFVDFFYAMAPAQFIFKVNDSGGADQAILILQQFVSPYIIEGLVTIPPQVADLVISAENLDFFPDSTFFKNSKLKNKKLWAISTAKDDFHLELLTRTDSTGAFSLALPPFMPMEWLVGSVDLMQRLTPDWVMPEPVRFFVDQVITGVNFEYRKAAGYISGTVTDENGFPLKHPDNQPLEVWVYAKDRANNFEVGRQTMNGVFILPVIEGNFEVGIDLNFGEFMFPEPLRDIHVQLGDSLIGHNFRLYKNNSHIQGKVTQEGNQPLKGIEIRAFSPKTGFNAAFTGHDGHYELPVSDKTDIYDVELAMEFIPPHLIVEGGNMRQAPPGAVHVDFNLIQRLLDEAPFIERIADIPNDQGLQVRLVWRASEYDNHENAWHEQITEYAVWRGVPTGKSGHNLPALLKKRKNVKRVESFQKLLNYTSKLKPGTSYVITNDSLMLWDFIVRMPAVQMPQYSVVAPTLGDSTDAGVYDSYFVVSAHTMDPYRHFFSPVAKGYSIDNLTPPKPVVVFQVNDQGIQLAWNASPHPDVIKYNVYRSNYTGFSPQEDKNLIAITPETVFQDTTVMVDSAYYYRVEAVDDAQNHTFSDEIGVLVARVSQLPSNDLPTRYSLSPNFPNPFNAVTKFTFKVSQTGRVIIQIYNLVGKEIKHLVDENKEPGIYQISWDARNTSGLDVASGIYIYRITVNEFIQSHKMLLLR